MPVILSVLSFDAKVDVVIDVEELRLLTKPCVEFLIIHSLHLVESLFGLFHDVVKPLFPLALEGTFLLLTRRGISFIEISPGGLENTNSNGAMRFDVCG